MPNPLKVAVDVVDAATTVEVGAGFPSSRLAAPYVQVGWDGTPSYADNREDPAWRLTYWTPPGEHSEAIDGAEHLLADLLSSQGAGNASLFRISRGAGRLDGTDADTANEFCTFTLNAALKAPATT